MKNLVSPEEPESILSSRETAYPQKSPSLGGVILGGLVTFRVGLKALLITDW